MKLVALVLLAACYTAARPSAPVPEADRRLAAADIEVQCGDTMDLTSPYWYSTRASAGVLDNRHIITAAHAVTCSEIPSVRATFADGRRERFWVTSEDAANDTAVLELGGAGALDLPIPAVRWPPADGPLCAVTTRAEACGELLAGRSGRGIFAARTEAGWSGAPVFDSGGYRVGIVVGGVGDVTAFVPPEGF